MMGAFLGKYWLQLVIAAAILAVLGYVHHQGYKQAEAHFAAQQAKADEVERRITSAIEKDLREGLAGIDRSNADRLAAIDRTDRTIVQPILEREIAHDPRYTNPACSVSDGVLGALNAARAASGAAGAAGGDRGSLPAGAAPRRP